MVASALFTLQILSLSFAPGSPLPAWTARGDARSPVADRSPRASLDRHADATLALNRLSITSFAEPALVGRDGIP